MHSGAGSAVLEFTSDHSAAHGSDFEAVALGYADAGVRFCRIRVDRTPELADAFQIRSVPTLIFVHNGEIVDALVGRTDVRSVSKRVEHLLSRARGEGWWRRIMGRGGSS